MIRHRFAFLLAALMLVLIFAPILQLVAPGSRPIVARTIFTLLFAVLLLSAVLAQVWGSVGVAVAVMLGLVVHNVIALCCVRSRLGFWPLGPRGLVG